VSKLERLLKLLAVLLDTTVPLSAENLRYRIGGYSEVDVSFRRAFERDKDDLRALGVTIRVEPVFETDPPIDGYRVDRDDYAGRDPGLDADELAALHLAAALVRFDSTGDDAFWKLGGGAAEEASPEPLVNVPTSAETTLLYTAVVERRLASFSYRGHDRQLEPARLTFNWYVAGHDLTREAERVFRLDRIDGTIELGDAESFEATSARGPELTRTWELGDAGPITARVAIDSKEAIWAQVHLTPAEIITTRPDGSVVVELQVRNIEAFRDWLLGFLENAEVLEPPELRSNVAEWLDSIVGGVA